MSMRRLFATFMALFALACAPEVITREAPTQIMLRIDLSSEELRKEFTELRITLARPSSAGAGEQVRWSTAATRLDRKHVKWPVDIPLLPQSRGDSFSNFEVVVDLLKGSRVLAQARAVTTFQPGERRVLPLPIDACPGAKPVCSEEDCHGPDCLVCKSDGRCARVGETDLKDLATIEEVTTEGMLTDGGRVRDGGARDDVRNDRDAEPRADASGSDAAIDPPPSDEAAGCTKEGALRCSAQGTGQRQRCDGTSWIEHEACATGSVCERDSDPAGGCRELANVCIGNTEATACDREQLVFCDADGQIDPAKTEPCKSERHCSLGRSQGKCAVCLPGEYRCQGAELEVCAENGMGFEPKETCRSAALCNATAGACTAAPCSANSAMCVGDELRTCKTDQSGFNPGVACLPGLCDPVGKQCDKCQPGQKSCMGNAVASCSADGQSLTMQACTTPRDVCTGAGTCVECTAAQPCAASTDPCKTTSCDLARGSCIQSNRPRGTSCGGSRVCNDSGACVACTQASHCPAPSNDCLVATCSTNNSCGTSPKGTGQPCAGGYCSSANRCVECTSDAQCTSGSARRCSSTNECVQCTSDSHCGSGQTCRNNSCVKDCGNGMLDPGEQCDPALSGWSSQTCDASTCQRSAYRSCASSSCPSGELCIYGACAGTCYGTSSDPDANCKSIPGYTSGCYLMACLLRCTSSNGCPFPLMCQLDDTKEAYQFCVGTFPP